MVAAAIFWDRAAEKYAKDPIADEATYQEKLRITQSYFRPDMEVLELGCGTGSTALLHAPFVKHIRATDISGEMIAIAKRKAADEGVSNVSFETASVETVEAADGAYDVVLALNLLHLLEDKDAGLARIHRFVKPGGVFISGTFCPRGAMWLFAPLLHVGRWFGYVPTVRLFTEKSLVASMTGAGFEIERLWRAGKHKAPFIVARKPV